MKKILALSVFLVTTQAFAFQNPIQQSAADYRAILKSILADHNLEPYTIKKISADWAGGKAELVDKGECIAIPYKISVDRHENTVAEVNTSEIATCD